MIIPFHEVLGWVKHPVSLLTAQRAPLRLPVVRQRAGLAEVVFAARRHRVGEHFAANAALVREVVLVRDRILVLVRLDEVPLFELLVHLPAMLVVGPIVHELTSVSEPAVAGLLVVLTQHGLVVPAHSGPHVGRRTDGLDGHPLADERLLLVDVLCVVVEAAVDLVVLLPLDLLRDLLCPLRDSSINNHNQSRWGK